MSGDGRRQRAVMATDAEWERNARTSAASSMELSRFVVHRALMADGLAEEVQRRAVREMLVLSKLEEQRLREAGAGAPGKTPAMWWTNGSAGRARWTG